MHARRLLFAQFLVLCPGLTSAQIASAPQAVPHLMRFNGTLPAPSSNDRALPAGKQELTFALYREQSGGELGFVALPDHSVRRLEELYAGLVLCAVADYHASIPDLRLDVDASQIPQHLALRDVALRPQYFYPFSSIRSLYTARERTTWPMSLEAASLFFLFLWRSTSGGGGLKLKSLNPQSWYSAGILFERGAIIFHDGA